MTSRHVFNTDIISGNVLWVDSIQSTGETIVNDSHLDVKENLIVRKNTNLIGSLEVNQDSVFNADVFGGKDFYVKGNSDLSGTLNVDQDATLNADVFVKGDAIIEGDLYVSGDQVTMETATVRVEDKNIELAVLDNSTDITADGGGITLKGDTDKTISWSNTTDSWDISEHLGVADGKYIFSDKLRARDAAGLSLEDDGGNGIFIKDGGNVAIGHSNPSAPLDIQNSVNHFIKFGYGVNYAEHQIRWDSATAAFHANFDQTSTGDNRRIILGVDGDEKMSIMHDGNVGIGTTNPSEVLDINGNVKVNNFYKAGGDLILSADADNDNADSSIRFNIDGNSNAQEKMRVTADGNVGIGTTNPYGKLHVQFNTGAYINFNYASNQFGDTSNDEAGLNYSNKLHLGAVNSANSPQVTMSLLKEGNVGIGTTSPSETLEVRTIGPAGASAAERTAKYNGISILTEKPGDAPYNGFGGGIVFNNETYTNGQIYSSAGIYGGIGDNSTLPNVGGHLAFHTSDTRTDDPTEKMRITADGNVGIGTADPLTKFHIKDNGSNTVLTANNSRSITIQDTSEVDNALSFLNFTTSNNFSSALIGTRATTNLSGASVRSDIIFVNRNSDDSFTEKMVIKSGGNVGIGVTSDLHSQLTIGDSSSLTNGAYLSLRNNNSDGGGRLATFGYVTNAITIGTRNESTGAHNAALASFSYSSIHFSTGSSNANITPRMVINTSGNVGIGTTNPGGKFEVSGGTSYLEGLSLRPASGTVTEINSGSSTYDLSIKAGANEVLRINKGGNLYLGPYLSGSSSNNKMYFIKAAPFNWTGANNQDELAAIGMGALETASDDGNISFRTAQNANTGGGLNEAMRIDSAGAVSIGNSVVGDTPAYGKLVVDSGIQIKGSGDTLLSITSTHASYGATYRLAYFTSGAYNGALRLYNTATNQTVLETKDDQANSGYRFAMLGNDNRLMGGAIGVRDIRTPEPNHFPIGSIAPLFTNWDLNAGLDGGSNYADGIHFNTYTDSSGQSSNLFVISKSSSAIKVSRVSYTSPSTKYKDGTIYSIDTTAGSDSTVKEQVEPINSALDTIKKLNPVTFAWTDEYIKNGLSKNSVENQFDEEGDRIIPSQKIRNVGLIAQEVEKIIPTVVHQDRLSLENTEEYLKHIDYEKLVPHLIAGMKEQQSIIEDLKNRIEVLENK